LSWAAELLSVGLAVLDHHHAGHATGSVVAASGLLITRVGGEVVVLLVEGVGRGLSRATRIRGEGQNVAVLIVVPGLAVGRAVVGPGAGLDAVVVVVGVGDDGAGVVPGLAVAGGVGVMLGFTKGVLPNLPNSCACTVCEWVVLTVPTVSFPRRVSD
jgi:hypothetical protein